MNALSLIANSMLLGSSLLDTSLEVLSFALGAVLLLVALFRSISLKIGAIANASKRMRVLAGILSIPFFLLALALHFDVFSGKEPPPADPAKIVVVAGLGNVDDAQEIATQLQVYIGGHPVPKLSLDLETPSLSHDVNLPGPGDYSYSIEGYSVWSTDPNSKVLVQGSGDIIIRDGVTYAVTWDRMDEAPSAAGQPWTVRLREN